MQFVNILLSPIGMWIFMERTSPPRWRWGQVGGKGIHYTLPLKNSGNKSQLQSNTLWNRVSFKILENVFLQHHSAAQKWRLLTIQSKVTLPKTYGLCGFEKPFFCYIYHQELDNYIVQYVKDSTPTTLREMAAVTTPKKLQFLKYTENFNLIKHFLPTLERFELDQYIIS